MHRRIKVNIALGACLLLALGVRLWSLDFGLPHRYHVDEPAHVLAALQMGRGNFQIDYPGLSPNLRQLLLLGQFGVLYSWYLLTGRVNSPMGFAQQYLVDPSPFYLAARGLSVVASLATIVLLYRLACRYRDEKMALVACAFLSLCFLDVRHAHFAEPYSLIALLVVVVTSMSVDHVRTGKRKYAVLAGLACGIAIGLRYSVLPLGVTLLLGVFLGWQRKRHWLSLVHTLALVAAAVAIGYVIGTPSIVVNTRSFVRTSIGQASLAASSEGFWGIQFTDMPSWQFYATVLEIAFGLPLALMVLLGVGLAVRRHSREDLLILSFPVAYGALLLTASGASSAFAHYLVPALPLLAFLAAEGTIASVGWLTRGRLQRRETLVLLFLVFALVLIPGLRIVRLDLLWTRTDTRTQAKDWIESHVPAGARIAEQWHGPPLATEYDPEPNSRRVYDVLILSPFSADPRLYSLDYYRNDGFEYLILSSFAYELRRADPAENAIRDAFYAALDREEELVAEFRPLPGGKELPFFFEEMWGPIVTLRERDRPGPVVKVYRIR